MSAAAALGGWIAAGIVGAMFAVAWRALESRMEAVARACHELRGPITAARLGLSLGSRVGELSPASLRALDVELGRASLALDDLAQMRGGTPRLPELQRVDLERLITDSVEACRGSGDVAGVVLSVTWTGASRSVWGDRLRLAQATGNLIANAIEHGSGAVEVRGAVRGGLARIEVLDDGPGLPAPLSELMRGARRGRGARGRGLAITSSIADAHGGRLAAAPSERGARMVLELPTAV
ncbi:MAG: HAMP domain-containing sensor histidine kinase [Solirubrobacteraceae bacterium]